MPSVILDVRSAESNHPETGLAERYVLGHTELDGTREYRNLYEDETQQILWVSLGDGSLIGERIEIASLGEDSRVFPYRVSVVEAEDLLGNPLEVSVKDLGYRVLSSSVIGRLVLERLDPLFMCTRNENGRARVGDYEGRSWSLLGGKKVEFLGRVGEGEIIVSAGEVMLGSVYGESLERNEVGGASLPIITEADLESYVFTDEIGVVGDESFKVRFNGQEGLNVYFASSLLGGSGVILEGSDALAGGLRDGEYPLIRSGRGEGYLDVEVVEDESFFVGGLVRSLRVARSTGAVERGTGLEQASLFFEGVAIGFATPLEAVDVTGESALPLRSGLVSGLSYLPDGTGISPTGVAPTSSKPSGTGLILGLEAIASSFFIMDGEIIKTELVDRLPSRLRSDRVYVKSDDFSIHTSRAHNELLFRQALIPQIGAGGGLLGAEMLGLTEPTVRGYDRLNGEELGEISGNSLFFFLDFKPRKDMEGSFSVGGSELVEGEDFLYRLDDSKIEWIEEVTSSGVIREQTFSIPLGIGVKAGTVSLSLEQEVSEGQRVSETLVEGVDFQISIDGQRALLTTDLSLTEKLAGGGSSELAGGAILLPNTTGQIEIGDWIVFGSDGVYRQVIGLDEGSIFVSNTEEIVHPSSWVVYGRAYEEGGEISDVSLLSAECFRSVPLSARPDMRVFKIKPDLDELLDERAEGSSLWVEGESGTRYPLSVLLPETLESNVLDVTDPHVSEGSYYLMVGAVGPLFEDTDFTVDEGGQILFSVMVGREQIILHRTPRLDLTDSAETDGLLVGAPEDIENYLEQVVGFNFERTTGGVSLDVPLREGEGLYLVYRPEGETDYVKEISSFSVSREVCTRESARVYKFNPTGKMLYPGSSVTVDVGVERIGYLGTEVAEVLDDQTISLPFDVEEGVEVKIDYLVSEAFGGERLTSASDPIFVRTLALDEGESAFEAEEIVTDYLSFGALVRIGNHAFTVTDLSVTDGIATVSLNPPARYAVTGELEVLSNGNIFYGVSGVSYSAIQGANEILLGGDLTSLLYEGSYLIFGSIPYEVSRYDLLESGQTKVFIEGISSALRGSGNLLLSARPIRGEGSDLLQMRTTILDGSTRRLIRYEGGRGAELIEGLDYVLEGDQVRLKRSYAIEVGISYYLHHSALTSIGPKVMRRGRVSNPSYEATYLTSSTGARFSGYQLSSDLYYETRDQFYLSKEEDATYVPKKASEIISLEQSLEGRTGGSRFDGEVINGRAIGRHDLEAEDVVVREQIKTYDAPVKASDLLRATVTGQMVGDKDGIFRMEIETSGQYGGAGLEDPILRSIQPRYVPLDLMGLSAPYEEITDQDLAEIKQAQKALIYNEIDDYVLTDRTVVTNITTSFPFRERVAYPVYDQMWKPHAISRLYTTEMGHFSELYEGPFTAERSGEVIGQVRNGALAKIGNISGLSLRKRKFRYRVWDYSADGFDQFPETSGQPTLILSAVPFEDFPAKAGGLIDLTQFLSEGGEVLDLVTGDPSLAISPIEEGAPIVLGSDNDPFASVVDEVATSSTDAFALLDGETRPRLARIRSVINPCVVTLGIYDDTLSLIAPNVLLRNGVELDVGRGYTLLESHEADLDESRPDRSYTVNTDIGLRSSTGDLINITKDFPYNIFNQQNVPDPLIEIEGTVTLGSASIDPFEYPALKGLTLNDSGDASVPYALGYSEQLVLPNLVSEIDRLKAIYAGAYVYPDDLRSLGDLDGEALTVSESLTPFTDGLEATVDVRAGDLVLIKPESGSTGDAITGFSEVARVDGDEIKIPVFTSPIPQGGAIFYQIVNAYLYGDPTGGIVIEQTLAGGIYTTTITRPVSEADLAYDDLFSALTSNTTVNPRSIQTAPIGNSVRFYLYAQGDSTFKTMAGTFQINITNLSPLQYEVVSSLGSVPITALSVQPHEIKTTSSAPWFDFSDPDLSLIQDLPDFKLTDGHPHSFDVYANKRGTSTASIESDRIGFTESYYMRARDKDGILPTELTVYDCQISVEEISIIFSQSTDLLSDLNSSSYLNSGNPFLLESNQNGSTLRPASWLGSDGTAQTRSGLSLEVWSGAEVSETDYLLSGNGALDMSLLTFIPRTNAQGAVDNVLPGDLLYIERGHHAGVHLIESSYAGSESVALTGVMGVHNAHPTIGSTLSYPIIESLITNGDGTLDLVMSETINEEHFAGAGGVSPLVLVIDPVALAEHHDTYDDLLFMHYESVDGNTFKNIGYLNFQSHAFVNAKFQNVSEADAINFITSAAGTGYATGHNRIPLPRYYTDGQSYRNRPTSDLTVTSSVLHGGEHNPYDLTITGFDYDQDGLITHFFLDYFNLPLIDSPNNFRAVILKEDNVQLQTYVPVGLGIDPTFPRLKRDLSDTASNYFESAPAFGPITYGEYDLSTTPAYLFGDYSDFTIRRLRRFGDALQDLNRSLEGVSLLYTERTGLVGSLTQVGLYYALTAQKTDGLDTNVGDFIDVVSVGDVITLTVSGSDETKMRVREVSDTLTLSPISGDPSLAHDSFKVHVRGGVIPEIQTLNDLLSFSFTTLFEGGYGTVSEVNVLADRDENFTDLSQVGDYVIIDPQGALQGSTGYANPIEYGAPPKGDISKLGYEGYVAGTPDPLDDNRGVYKVINVTEVGALEVEPVVKSIYDRFNLLPTVDGGSQGVLRVTAPSDVNNSFTGSTDSVEGFSYRIVRAKVEDQASALEWFLFLRERTLSWYEQIGGLKGLSSYGWVDYYERSYERFVGVSDFTHPSNENIFGIEGETFNGGFINSATCLSILDRRALIGDYRMLEDALFFEEVQGYLTYLESALESLSLREDRFYWINKRVGSLYGTLARLNRI